MTKRKKIIERFRENPKSVRFEEMEIMLLSLGFEKRNTGSSHFVFKHVDYPVIRITVPFKKPFIGAVYVRQVLEQLEQYGVLDDLLD